MYGEKLTVTLRMREDCHFCTSNPIFNFEINHIQTPSHVGNIQNHLGGLQNLDESSHVLFYSFFFFSFFFQTSTAILVNASPLSLYIYIYIYMFVSVFIFNFDMYFDVSYALSKYQCLILLMYFHQALDINSKVSVFVVVIIFFKIANIA